MRDHVARSGLREHLAFFGRFLRSPQTIGAVAPSSPALVRRMLAHLDAGAPARVVELGPGTGAMTRAVVQRLGPASRFMAVELDPVFVSQLQQELPGLDVVQGSAAELERFVADREFGAIDHVISGLPFASLPVETTRRILDGLSRTLRPGGTFTTFQYVYSFVMPPAVAFRREASARFGGPPARALVLMNLPPAWVLTWRKPGDT
jgi:phospholipid N-methyltransferase